MSGKACQGCHTWKRRGQGKAREASPAREGGSGDAHDGQLLGTLLDQGREEEVITRLSRVGYDNTLGFLDGGVEAWKAAGKDTESVAQIQPDALAQRLMAGEDMAVLDVRKPTEFLSQHLEEALNFPLDYINANMNRLDQTQTYYVHCKGGYRSMITISILMARGYKHLVDVALGWNVIADTQAPTTAYVCPTTLSAETVEAAIESVS